MKRFVVGAAILAALIGLVGCGQRGALYLPTPPADRAADGQQPDAQRR